MFAAFAKYLLTLITEHCQASANIIYFHWTTKTIVNNSCISVMYHHWLPVICVFYSSKSHFTAVYRRPLCDCVVAAACVYCGDASDTWMFNWRTFVSCRL